MKNKFDKTYWENKYKTNQTGWDIGDVSKPLKDYIDQIDNKNVKILIPGGGNSHEAEYLWQEGFKNIIIIDLTELPLSNFKKRVPDFPDSQLICTDFFNYQGSFDLIIEQTFFCALDPLLRESYVLKTNDLLNEKGKLAGLLFDFPLNNDGPPFGGSKLEYVNLFKYKYTINVLERAYNSIKSRQNRELFFIFEKK